MTTEQRERLVQAVAWMTPGDRLTGFEELGQAIAAVLSDLDAAQAELALLRRCVADADVMREYCCSADACTADWCVAWREWQERYGQPARAYCQGCGKELPTEGGMVCGECAAGTRLRP